MIDQIGTLPQSSARRTLARCFRVGCGDMTSDQIARAEVLMRRTPANRSNWSVINNTMETFTEWAVATPGPRT
ncbi:MAG: hypothetical protein GDA53_03935 [Rhodobacteraceae bacterium]|nr:hypothetical protein [Paracoccaceae bacterium]